MKNKVFLKRVNTYFQSDFAKQRLKELYPEEESVGYGHALSMEVRTNIRQSMKKNDNKALSLQEYLNQLLREKDVTRKNVIDNTGLSKTYIGNLLSGYSAGKFGKFGRYIISSLTNLGINPIPIPQNYPNAPKKLINPLNDNIDTSLDESPLVLFTSSYDMKKILKIMMSLMNYSQLKSNQTASLFFN